MDRSHSRFSTVGFDAEGAAADAASGTGNLKAPVDEEAEAIVDPEAPDRV